MNRAHISLRTEFEASSLRCNLACICVCICMCTCMCTCMCICMCICILSVKKIVFVWNNTAHVLLHTQFSAASLSDAMMHPISDWVSAQVHALLRSKKNYCTPRKIIALQEKLLHSKKNYCSQRKMTLNSLGLVHCSTILWSIHIAVLTLEQVHDAMLGIGAYKQCSTK